MKLIKAVFAAVLMTTVSFANASLFTYTIDNPNPNPNNLGSDIENITSTYSADAERFTWMTEFTPGSDVDGFWLVVNNGPNPKSSDVNELAIMYGDLSSGTLSTYVYNGQNNANSISNPSIFLQTDAISVGSDTFTIDISTAAINSWSSDPNYSGIAFDENVGIWFHVSSGSNFTTNTEGDITDYSFSDQGWYDVANRQATVEASAPGTLALFGLALAGLAFARRRMG